ncbi:3-hydroxyacyl-CoA dehydrogenase [Paracoccus stylophorae]|uniref:3-hydroxyacyl-CoA dehydrogenase n=1 Tax=Paracoccus stylophorae TaxID=659350 RepID=A0ABY7STQ5_9RHOB|nr:3-hydroxyacyl-CoA dehydrogenase NAD-binding domain-containing protein [Paracoccus stylophorae]WCR09792.1 3-hydroxyacyl-CoA dehydrogenase [Paracoccus stylophorae]
MDERAIAILGSGLIGESWAGLFAGHGYEVRCWDIDPSVATRAVLGATKIASAIAGPARQAGRITSADDLSAALEDASWVQENIVERVPEKQSLYRQVLELAGPDLLIASSTSSLTWTDLTTGLAGPDRVLTAHPFNPPHLMPLVEIYAASTHAAQRADQFYRHLDREPVFLNRPAVGHIANRLSSALWREAVNIVAEGIADVEAVDCALVNGPGLRWSVIGAHMAYHLGGGEGGIRHYLEHLGPSQERRWADLGSPALTPEVVDKLIEGIEAEADGRSVQELVSERDDAIERILKALKQPMIE